METIITTTNVPLKAKAAIPEAWIETPLDSGKELKDGKVVSGIYFRVKTDKIAVFTVEEIDLVDKWNKASKEDRLTHFSDGYKRTKINSPAAIHIKTALGLIEKSKSQREKEEFQNKVYADMLAAGIDEEQAKRIAFPTRG